MIKRELDLTNIVDDYEANMHKNVGNVYLTDNQMQILDKYGIDYKNAFNTKELMYKIEFTLNELDGGDDLEKVSEELSEFHYYHDTNK